MSLFFASCRYVSFWQRHDFPTLAYRPATSSILLPPLGDRRALAFMREVQAAQDSCPGRTTVYHIFRHTSHSLKTPKLAIFRAGFILAIAWDAYDHQGPSILLSCSQNLPEGAHVQTFWWSSTLLRSDVTSFRLPILSICVQQKCYPHKAGVRSAALPWMFRV